MDGEETLPAAYGEPLAGDEYAFCLYDQSGDAPRLIVDATAPGGSMCGETACWRRPSDRHYVYRDRRAGHGALTRLDLRPGLDGQTHITVRGEGELLGLPALPLDLPLLTQLRGANGACWETRHGSTGVGRNDPVRFRATAE